MNACEYCGGTQVYRNIKGADECAGCGHPVTRRAERVHALEWGSSDLYPRSDTEVPVGLRLPVYEPPPPAITIEEARLVFGIVDQIAPPEKKSWWSRLARRHE